jgi:hypothetical protein
MANYMQAALSSLNMTIADLRDPARAEQIRTEAARLKSAAKSERSSGPIVRRDDVFAALETFPGFRDDPSVYGPGVAEITDALSENFPGVKRNAVYQHLAKLIDAGEIGSARKLETNGKRGAPPVFFFALSQDDNN